MTLFIADLTYVCLGCDAQATCQCGMLTDADLMMRQCFYFNIIVIFVFFIRFCSASVGVTCDEFQIRTVLVL